jgi:hypothetical protein
MQGINVKLPGAAVRPSDVDFDDPDMVDKEDAQLIGMQPISDQCSVNACDQPVSSVAYYKREGHNHIVWSCDEHIDYIGDTGLVSEDDFTRIEPTCGLARDTPCGAMATHVVVLRDGDDRIRTASVCARHAGSGPRKRGG